MAGRLLTALFGVAACLGPIAAAGVPPAMLALPCTTCHSLDGPSTGNLPLLRGMERRMIVEEMAAFRTGERSSIVMGRIARGYTEAEVELIADYFSAVEPDPR